MLEPAAYGAGTVLAEYRDFKYNFSLIRIALQGTMLVTRNLDSCNTGDAASGDGPRCIQPFPDRIEAFAAVMANAKADCDREGNAENHTGQRAPQDSVRMAQAIVSAPFNDTGPAPSAGSLTTVAHALLTAGRWVKDFMTPPSEVRNAQGQVVFPTNPLERWIRNDQAVGAQAALAFLVGAPMRALTPNMGTVADARPQGAGAIELEPSLETFRLEAGRRAQTVNRMRLKLQIMLREMRTQLNDLALTAQQRDQIQSDIAELERYEDQVFGGKGADYSNPVKSSVAKSTGEWLHAEQIHGLPQSLDPEGSQTSAQIERSQRNDGAPPEVYKENEPSVPIAEGAAISPVGQPDSVQPGWLTAFGLHTVEDLKRAGYDELMGNPNILAKYTKNNTPRDIRILDADETVNKYIRKLLNSSNRQDVEIGTYLSEYKFLVRTNTNASAPTVDDVAVKLRAAAMATAPEAEAVIYQGFRRIGDGKLLGLEGKIKSQDSLVDKLVNKAANRPFASDPVQEAAKDIRDAVRYTAVFDFDRFTDHVQRFMAELESSGWAQVHLLNTYVKGAPYKSINTIWRDGNNMNIEIQFQTDEGYHINQHTHDTYKWKEYLASNENVKIALEDLGRSATEQIRHPKGVDSIQRAWPKLTTEQIEKIYRGNDADVDIPANTLTKQEIIDIQSIANRYNTPILVVGGRARGEGREIYSDLPVGKGYGITRSDIDFRIDAEHPQINELIEELKRVGRGAGAAKIRFNTNSREAYQPSIRFEPMRDDRH